MPDCSLRGVVRRLPAGEEARAEGKEEEAEERKVSKAEFWTT